MQDGLRKERDRCVRFQFSTLPSDAAEDGPKHIHHDLLLLGLVRHGLLLLLHLQTLALDGHFCACVSQVRRSQNQCEFGGLSFRRAGHQTLDVPFLDHFSEAD